MIFEIFFKNSLDKCPIFKNCQTSSAFPTAKRNGCTKSYQWQKKERGKAVREESEDVRAEELGERPPLLLMPEKERRLPRSAPGGQQGQGSGATEGT